MQHHKTMGLDDKEYNHGGEKYFGTLDPKQRSKITVHLAQRVQGFGAESWFMYVSLREVLAIVRDRCNSDGLTRVVRDNEGYCEHIHPSTRFTN
jgi:hypothetical protein